MLESIKGSISKNEFVAGEPITMKKLVKKDGSGVMSILLPKGMRAVSVPISAETGAGGFILPGDRVDVILTRRVTETKAPEKIESKADEAAKKHQAELDAQNQAVDAATVGNETGTTDKNQEATTDTDEKDTEQATIAIQTDETGEELIAFGGGYYSETVFENVKVLAIDQQVSEKESSAIGRTATLEVPQDQAEVLSLALKIGEISLSLRSFEDNYSEKGEDPSKLKPKATGVLGRDQNRAKSAPQVDSVLIMRGGTTVNPVAVIGKKEEEAAINSTNTQATTTNNSNTQTQNQQQNSGNAAVTNKE
jgi:Flp pilus assembly protein CpaB